MTLDDPETARLDDVDRRLREMMRTFSALPIPGRLLSVLDQLDDASDAEPPRVSKRRN